MSVNLILNADAAERFCRFPDDQRALSHMLTLSPHGEGIDVSMLFGNRAERELMWQWLLHTDDTRRIVGRLIGCGMLPASVVGYFGFANLQEVNLKYALLLGTIMPFADLTHANLISSRWERCQLHGVNLHGASLQCASILSTNLSWANLTKANLSHAVICYSNMNSADLTDADLEETLFVSVSYNDNTAFPQEFDPTAHPGLIKDLWSNNSSIAGELAATTEVIFEVRLPEGVSASELQKRTIWSETGVSMVLCGKRHAILRAKPSAIHAFVYEQPDREAWEVLGAAPGGMWMSDPGYVFLYRNRVFTSKQAFHASLGANRLVKQPEAIVRHWLD